ncbi:MAG TPA: SpoIIE family protein phosphatase [Candidatus Polarisedimenticolia bacterium]|nr:SpoIIE family protein phosphatase [Candidatus Polarisedimenticolia bacterium]
MASPVESLLREQLTERREKLESVAHAVPADDQIRRLLRDVDAALARMDEGTFGICESCHDTIEADRLVADPLMTYCLDHLTKPQRQALEADLDLAAQVLRGLLPPPSLNFPGYEVARHYEGAGPVSGDYCDAVGGEDGSLYFAVGDVSGKGVAASMLMAHLHATLRALVPLNLALDQLVTRASGLFCESALPSHFATLVVGRAGRSGDVEICNAGHVPPLVARGREIERVAPTGLPIGMFCDARFSVSRVRLSPGDTILLYTDGVNEALDRAGQEYGLDRLSGLLAGHSSRGPSDLLASCLRDLQTFRGGVSPRDDLTLMAVRHVA